MPTAIKNPAAKKTLTNDRAPKAHRSRVLHASELAELARSSTLLMPSAASLAWFDGLSEETQRRVGQMLAQRSRHEVVQLRHQLRAIAAAGNVDTSDPPEDRATQFLGIARDAVIELDGANKDNVVSFLVRTAWHEGAALTQRVQSGGGPARSFMQMEPGAAKDGVTRAKKKGWLSSLATASGTSETDLTSAAAALNLGSPWPAANLIEEDLKSFDLFGVEVARSYLSAGSTVIPTDTTEQADYWESDWHRVVDAKKKAQWLAAATAVNKLLGWP